MIEKEVIVTTKHGNMPSFVAYPDGPGSFPVGQRISRPTAQPAT